MLVFVLERKVAQWRRHKATRDCLEMGRNLLPQHAVFTQLKLSELGTGLQCICSADRNARSNPIPKDESLYNTSKEVTLSV